MTSTAQRGLLSDVLASRWMCAGIAGAAALHIALGFAGVGGWPCPIRLATGVPCPGCGLGRACAELMRGNLKESFQFHAFAPVVVGFVALCACGAALGKENRARWVDGLGRIERRAPIAPAILTTLIVYWLVRLVLDARAVSPLVSFPVQFLNF